MRSMQPLAWHGDTVYPSLLDPRTAEAFLETTYEAYWRELGETGIDARIVNISESGFMAESDGRFEVGSRVWLMLPGRDRANAVIKWTAGDKLGAEFAEPISLEGLSA